METIKYETKEGKWLAYRLRIVSKAGSKYAHDMLNKLVFHGLSRTEYGEAEAYVRSDDY